MIRGGLLCRSCTRGHCRSLSTEHSRVEIECPVCDGAGCDQCDNGVFAVDGCPNAFCSSMVTPIDLFELFGKGLPPISGGVLDQSASFVHASQFFESEELKVRNERSSRNPD